MAKRRARKRGDRTARERKRRQLAREAMGRVSLHRGVEPKFDQFCRALERLAAGDVHDVNPAVRKAIAAIRMNEPGWQYDRRGLAAIATALLDQWSSEWGTT